LRADPFYISNLATALDQSSGSEAALTNELSSGLRVSSLQDDPVAVSQNTVISSSIAADDNYVQVASSEQSLMQVSDSA